MAERSPTLFEPPNDRQDGYLPTLDGWRAVAILLVMACHGGLSNFSPAVGQPSAGLQNLLSHGWVGVNVFFAISGFLICTRLLREQQRTGDIDLRSFYIRRAFRILPPYLIYLAVLSPLAAAGRIIVPREEFISCLFFVRNYLPWTKVPGSGWYTGHFWSLAIEEHFYLLWPFILLVLSRQRAARAAVGMIAAVTIWRTVDPHFASLLTAGRVFEHRTDTQLDSLLWGCIFAMLFASERSRQWLQRWIGPAGWLSCVALLVYCVMHLNALTAVLRPPLFAAVVIGTLCNPRGFVSSILEDPRLRWLGRISYSLYIWQQLFLVWNRMPRPLPFGQWQEVPMSFFCVFIFAMASYYFIEQPMVRLGQRLSRAQTSASAASSSSMAVISSAGASA